MYHDDNMLIFTQSLDILLIVMQYREKGTIDETDKYTVKTQQKKISAICLTSALNKGGGEGIR